MEFFAFNDKAESVFTWCRGRTVQYAGEGGEEPRGFLIFEMESGEQYSPLLEETALFLNFSALESCRSSFTDFARKFGRLGFAEAEIEDTETPGFAENLRAWEDFHDWTQWTIRGWRAAQSKDEDAATEYLNWASNKVKSNSQRIPLRSFRDGIRVGVPCLSGAWNNGSFTEWVDAVSVYETFGKKWSSLSGLLIYIAQDLSVRLQAMTIPRLDSGMLFSGHEKWADGEFQPRFSLQPKTLAGALTLQISRAFIESKQYRQCRNCSKWFELAPGVNNSSREHCGRQCQNQNYRKRVAFAQELFEGGTDVETIADMMETNIETVRGWIERSVAKAKKGEADAA